MLKLVWVFGCVVAAILELGVCFALGVGSREWSRLCC